MSTHHPHLPDAKRDRWQPMRCGLVNLFKYDDQQFRFENGRLLLRGHNGTGKSRVLALTLPFLFDGQTTPHRVEPDQDPAKRMAWNLLMGRHDDRVGYTWLELGRRTGDGASERAVYQTIGCGLSATKGKAGVTTWFFITDRRVGQDLSLCPDRVPLTKARLAEALGERGQVIDTAQAYRQTIDANFFELGLQRYEAMLRLLIELRRPQLSRTLDEQGLSQALSEALPPLDERVLHDVADAMNELEKERQSLEDYQSAQAGVDAFLQTYRRYTRIAARRVAEPVRKAHAAYENAARILRQAGEKAEQAERALAQSQRRLGGCQSKQIKLREQVQTLAASPEMRSLQNLHDAQQQLKEQETRLKGDREAQAKAQTTRDRQQAHHELQRTERKQQTQAASDAATTAQSHAEHAALGGPHRQAVGDDVPTALASERSRQQALNSIHQAVTRQERSIKLLRQRVEQVRRHEQAKQQAEDRRDDAQGFVATANEQLREAELHINASIEQTVTRYAEWHALLAHITMPETDDLAEELEGWVADQVQGQPGASPLTQALDHAKQRFGRAHAKRVNEAEGQQARLIEARDEVQREIDALETGRHTPPPAPHTRDTAGREARAGAPLWRLIDFQPGVDEAARCGIEAAMESAGLLDAWLMPDGRLMGDTQDTFLIAPSESQTAGQHAQADTLASVLTPADQLPRGMEAAVVQQVLCVIGWGRDTPHPSWIDAQGRWQNGPVGGRWTKPAVQHIGQAAREAERQRRLAELHEQSRSLLEQIQQTRQALSQLEQEQAAASEEADSAPDDEAIRSAIAALHAQQTNLEAARTRAAEAEQALIQASQQLTQARDQRDRDAHDAGLLEWVDRLDELSQHLHQYTLSAQSLGHALQRWASATEAAEHARQDLAMAQQALDEQARRVAQAKGTTAKAAARVQALEATIGGKAEDIQAAYTQAQSELEAIESEIEAARTAEKDAIGKQAQAKAQCEHAEQTHTTAQALRHEAIETLHDFVGRGFLQIADPEAGADLQSDDPWSATRGVEVARRLDAAFDRDALTDEAWQNAKRNLQSDFDQLKETLTPKGYPPQSEAAADDLNWITVPYQNQYRSVAELGHLLRGEVQERQTLLDEKEKEVIENHLIDEVAVHLHQRIQAGDQQVARMNDQLRGRAMSTGMELRFKWAVEADADDRLIAARRQLLQSPDAQSPDQRESLAEFLQHQIRAVREDNELPTWHDALAWALDYRRWHRFGVERRHEPGAPWQPLTKRTHGTGSGGEKAIALTIPQFAAAAAHYSSASKRAPRLIMLDEAFVGVDPDMRSKCMTLLTDFDLDLLMTSESEWGCYPGLDGNAIYQLATRQGMDAILCTRWVWNGQRKTQDPTPDRPHDNGEFDQPAPNRTPLLDEQDDAL